MPRIAIAGGTPAYGYGHTPVQPIGGVGGRPGVDFVALESIQAAGLIPLLPCDTLECREICESGRKNTVFGELTSGGYQVNQTYENDWNSFWIDVSLYNANPSAVTVDFVLEKFFDGEWRGYPFGLNLNSNAFGQLFTLGTVPGHPSYAGYSINLGAVLFNVGTGCYRFKAHVSFTTYTLGQGTTGGTQAECVFQLPTNSCLSGAIKGVLKTISGNIPAVYNINQTNSGFTEAQNVTYIVALVNAGTYPYTAVDNGGNKFTITGQSYSQNNNISWQIVTNKLSGGFYVCDYAQTERMDKGIDPVSELIATVHEVCYESPPFNLLAWDCMRAHGTVKFETWMSGIIGDPYTDYKKHNFCGLYVYDSIRVSGFFGYEKSPTYLKNNLKWGGPKLGKIEKVSDEQTQRWEYLSKYLPEYIHSRFATFGMMSDKLFASDYNVNNSSYNYKRKNVIYDSGYEPEYIDKEAFWQRRNKSKVQVFFNRGVQSVMKSLCCPTT